MSQIRHVVQYAKINEEGEIIGGWYDDNQFYNGWFYHNPSWSEEPSEELVKAAQKYDDKIPHLTHRIVVMVRSYSRRVI